MSARDDYPYMADLVRSYGRNVKPENNELVRALAELDLLRVEVADLKAQRDTALADLLELRTALVKWEQSRLALVRSRTSSDQIRYDDRTVALAALVPARWWGIEETR